MNTVASARCCVPGERVFNRFNGFFSMWEAVETADITLVARITGLKPGVNETAEKHPFFLVGKKVFVLHAKNSCFLKRSICLYSLTETRLFSQRLIIQKNAVKPTVGFIFPGSPCSNRV